MLVPKWVVLPKNGWVGKTKNTVMKSEIWIKISLPLWIYSAQMFQSEHDIFYLSLSVKTEVAHVMFRMVLFVILKF